MKKIIKRNNAITLIALVITMIVLLILVGVTISSITGSGLLGTTNKAKENVKYENAKETLDIELQEILVECISKKIDYNIIEIAKNLKETDNIEIEKYFIEETATIKPGVTENLIELSDIVVNVIEYPNYHFLIGEKGEVKGVTTRKITNYISKEEFNSIDYFEKNTLEIMESEKLGIEIENVRITLEDGTEAEINKYDLETKLIIDFDTSIEQGTITSVSPEVPYTTSGTEMEKEFTITAEFDGKEYTRKIKISVKEKYKLKVPDIIVKKENGTIVATTQDETINYSNEELKVEAVFAGLGKAYKKEISIDNGQTYSIYTRPVSIDKNSIVKVRATKESIILENELAVTQIDKLEPSTVIASVESDLISNSELEITATGEDAEATEIYGKSGIEYYNYYVYKNNELIANGTDKNQETKGKWKAEGLTVGDTYDIQVEAVDRAGNTKKSSAIQYTKIAVYTWSTYSTKQVFSEYTYASTYLRKN